MLLSGAVTLMVWLMVPLGALISGAPPARLDSYTTLFTHALDMAVIVPAALVSGIYVLRRALLGYLLACLLLVLEAMLAPLIVAQTISQLWAGVALSTGEIVGPIGGFVTIAVFAVGMLVALLRRLGDEVALHVAYV